MRERSSQILESIVREFIKTGEPVGSRCLYENYDFGIKPATIRLELTELANDGYLSQPYHSAGRMPTDRGLSLFAEEALKRARPAPRMTKNLEKLLAKEEWSNLLSQISEELRTFGFVHLSLTGETYKDGLDDFFENFEWDSPEEVKKVIEDFECIEERFLEMENEFLKMQNATRFFVGPSPITRSSSTSVFMADCRADGDRIFFAMVGPKRMDYEKAAKVMKTIANRT